MFRVAFNCSSPYSLQKKLAPPITCRRNSGSLCKSFSFWIIRRNSSTTLSKLNTCLIKVEFSQCLPVLKYDWMMTDLLNCSAGGCWFGICTKLTKFPDKSWMPGKQLCLETFPLEQPSVAGQKCSDCSADCRASSTHQPSLLILLQSSFLFSSLSPSPPSSSSDLGWVLEMLSSF